MERLSIEGYEIGALLGNGGVGTVYLARRTPSGARAAVKILDHALAPDRQRPAIFLNEAVAATAIGHPGIVGIIDLGQLADGRPYLVRDVLEGESLGDRFRRVQRLPVADAVDFARQVASALDAAHEEGIVHGALSPENLVLITDLSLPRGERVKVLDFGVGRLRVRARAGDDADADAYLAPEQREQDGTEVDRRADVHALGAILYHALCGVPPGATSAVRPRIVNPDVPAHIEDALLRALALRPEERFDSMAAFAAALAGDASATPAPRPARAGRVVLGSVAVAATVVAVLLWSGVAPGRAAVLARARALLGVSASAAEVTGTPPSP
jgi:eukaryotic-like serine/threonine-protein kinase